MEKSKYIGSVSIGHQLKKYRERLTGIMSVVYANRILIR